MYTRVVLVVFLGVVVLGVGVNAYGTCSFKGKQGKCMEERQCMGKVIKRSQGAKGCEKLKPSVECCLPAQGPVECTFHGARGECLPVTQCSAKLGRAIPASEGAEGCESFKWNIRCCLPPPPLSTTRHWGPPTPYFPPPMTRDAVPPVTGVAGGAAGTAYGDVTNNNGGPDNMGMMIPGTGGLSIPGFGSGAVEGLLYPEAMQRWFGSEQQYYNKLAADKANFVNQEDSTYAQTLNHIQGDYNNFRDKLEEFQDWYRSKLAAREKDYVQRNYEANKQEMEQVANMQNEVAKEEKEMLKDREQDRVDQANNNGDVYRTPQHQEIVAGIARDSENDYARKVAALNAVQDKENEQTRKTLEALQTYYDRKTHEISDGLQTDPRDSTSQNRVG